MSARSESHGPASVQRVLHVIHGYPPESGGGIEAYVEGLIRSQIELGLSPSLLHGSFEARDSARLEPRDDLPCPAQRLHRDDAYSDYWDKSHHEGCSQKYAEHLEALAPDLVHIHQWIRLSDDLVERSEQLGIPTVVSLHDVSPSCPACFRLRPDDSHCERSLSPEHCLDCVPTRGHESEAELRLGIEVYRRNFRHELLRARKVLAATHATADLVCSGLGLDNAMVEILPLAYEPRFGGASLRGEEATDSRSALPLRVAYWGNITHRKGCQALCEAMRMLSEQRSLDGKIQVDLFGRIDTESLRAELEEKARGLPIRFHGRYEYEEIAATGPDLAAFPSTCFETYGFVLDEAFELGIPALVTDVGAFQERLRGAGFLVPPGDAAAIARTLGRVLDDKELLKEKAARIPKDSMSPESHARALLRKYEEAQESPKRVGAPLDTELRTRLAAMREGQVATTEPNRRGISRADDSPV